MEKELNKNFEPFKLNWVATYQTRLLPPFNMVKAKHNNKTKVNVSGSGIETYVSNGRKKQNPYSYKCNFINEEEGSKVQRIFWLFGIYPSLQTEPEITMEVEYSDVMKFIGRVNKNQKKKLYN